MPCSTLGIMASAPPLPILPRVAPDNPDLWFQAAALTGTHNSDVLTWTDSAYGVLQAAGKKGVGATSKYPSLQLNEVFPYVRIGSGGSSTSDGGYFDLGARTYNVGTGGGLTILACVRAWAKADYARLINISNNRSDGIYVGQDDSASAWWCEHASVPGTRTTGASMLPRQWIVVAFRYNAQGLAFWANRTKVFSWAQASTPSNKTYSNNYLGQNTWSNPLANLDYREVLVYEHDLNDATVLAEVEKMVTHFRIA